MTLAAKPFIRPAVVTALLLLVPLVAMQFTREVTWSLADFIVAGGLLFGTGCAYELVARHGSTGAYRLAAGGALATALLLVWVNLAVGLIGSEANPVNLLYGGVLTVGLVGAISARFRPAGMARAMFATALAQAGVTVLALLIGRPQATAEVGSILGVNAFFSVLWVGAAWLFRRAASLASHQRAA